MRKNAYFINILLMFEVGLFYLGQILVQMWMPSMIFPKMSLPFLVLLSVIPMVISSYMERACEEMASVSFFMAGITFVIAPWCAGMDTGYSPLSLFVAGAAVFGITKRIYTSMQERMSSGMTTKFAPVVHGFLLFLASQCFFGFF